MHVHELSRETSLDFLSRSLLGRLACVKDLQSYVTPCYFAYKDRWIYSFSTVGQKVDWLRANLLACLEVDEIKSGEEWTCVIVFGRYEELTDTDGTRAAREIAHDVLQHRPLWWEPGYVRTDLYGKPRPLEPVYYRLSISKISGRRATQNNF